MSQKLTQSKSNLIIAAAVMLILAVALVFAVVNMNSRANAEQPEADGALANILSKGKIVVAMEGTWLPWTYHDMDTDALTGFDVEVSKAIAEKLGVEVEFVECPWDSIFAGIEVGRYDMAVNGIDWTEERAANLTLSDPYVYNYPVLIVRSDNTEITSFEDLKGKTTANTVSSTYAALAESYGATNRPVDDLVSTFQLLINRQIDATVNSADTFQAYMSEVPGAPLKIVAQADEANSVVIAMKGGEDYASLAAAVNNAIAELKADGTLAELSIKYFGSDMTQAPTAE